MFLRIYASNLRSSQLEQKKMKRQRFTAAPCISSTFVNALGYKNSNGLVLPNLT
jgi:hypothetical protein